MGSSPSSNKGFTPQFISSSSSVSVSKDEFLPDSRVEQISDRLHRELKLPDEMSFATSFDPEHWVKDDESGVIQPMQDRVVFWAVIPNPQPRSKGKSLKQVAFVDIDEWRKAEATKWRFAGMPDPAYLVFRELAARLKKDHKQWEELN